MRTDPSAANNAFHVPAVRESTCPICDLKPMCAAVQPGRSDIEAPNDLVCRKKTIKRGEALYRSGDSFTALYAVRSGVFKCQVASEDGRNQVIGFRMAGELIGLEGIDTDRHSCDAVALEASEVCVAPYVRVENLSREVDALQHLFHKAISREIVRDHGVMVLLGSMRGDERLASFLLNMSQHFAARGKSATEFVLRMTRADIGSFLGLKHETVSRAFSKFQEAGLISVQQKHIRIADMPGLKRVIGQPPPLGSPIRRDAVQNRPSSGRP